MAVDKDPCTICMEENISVRASIPCCDHTFCFDCIVKWSKQENTCPLCKKRFRQIDKIESSGNNERASSSRKRKARGSNPNSVKVPRRSQSNNPAHMVGEHFEIHAMMRQLFGRLQEEVTSSRVFYDPEFMSVPLSVLMRDRGTSMPFNVSNAHRAGNHFNLDQVRFLQTQQPGDVGTSASNPVVLEESEEEEESEVEVIEDPAIRDIRSFGAQGASAGASSSSSVLPTPPRNSARGSSRSANAFTTNVSSVFSLDSPEVLRSSAVIAHMPTRSGISRSHSA